MARTGSQRQKTSEHHGASLTRISFGTENRVQASAVKSLCLHVVVLQRADCNV